RARGGGDRRRRRDRAERRPGPGPRGHARARGDAGRRARGRARRRRGLSGGRPAAAGRSGAMTIRVLLVDDQALARDGFRLIVTEEPDIAVVGEAPDGRQAVELTKRLIPHVVLMDVRMPVMNGIEATSAIAASGVPSRVLILTTFDLDEYV